MSCCPMAGLQKLGSSQPLLPCSRDTNVVQNDLAADSTTSYIVSPYLVAEVSSSQPRPSLAHV